MMTKFYNKKILFLLLIIIGSFFVIKATGIYFNIYSNSLPYGLYKKVKNVPAKGLLAATCLTQEIAQEGLMQGYLQTGHCSTGIRPVMKRIVGQEGDSIFLKDNRILINGEKLADCQILNNDSQGRTIERFYEYSNYVLRKGEYWLMSDYKPNSWDSRYWGVVSIEFVLKPLFTWGG